MKKVSITVLRRRVFELFSEVENGEILLVLRHGRPIAEIGPVSMGGRREPAWKWPGLKLAVHGAGLTAAILEERNSTDHDI
jgi:antitoxin (DNA-binding transcriptional repressor) of toxin-antitoxin stability system